MGGGEGEGKGCAENVQGVSSGAGASVAAKGVGALLARIYRHRHRWQDCCFSGLMYINWKNMVSTPQSTCRELYLGVLVDHD